MDQCSEDVCIKPVHSKGLCQPHYRQMLRRERGLQKPGPKPDPSKPHSRYAPPKERKLKTHCKYGHEFTKENTYRDKRNARHCKTCNRENQRKYRPVAKYGLTSELMQQKLDEQNGKCAICQREFSEYLPYSVDHDHKCCSGEYTCGKCVRSLLCRRCNSLIGMVDDRIDILQNAIEYIRTTNKG